jgi:hypothetical protein
VSGGTLAGGLHRSDGQITHSRFTILKNSAQPASDRIVTGYVDLGGSEVTPARQIG